MSPHSDAAYRVIKLLEDRSGFDDWWDGIDNSTKSEILKKMRQEIKNAWEAREP